ncbi:hypothetical protein WOLCODRAFT_146016 [Wolfiporia cocos MD-104 SS10]|uniref:Uncharacterized protein n=1 Tax=Wolfiporia cocos (strain MD-104) TaxID=742152 RepID=A0A2H3J1U2_WOLCO|nr:hypothetical protein WOLCODRAFT_146016 [Wolfiporia cocos MD-104 SS10]
MVIATGVGNEIAAGSARSIPPDRINARGPTTTEFRYKSNCSSKPGVRDRPAKTYVGCWEKLAEIGSGLTPRGHRLYWPTIINAYLLGLALAGHQPLRDIYGRLITSGADNATGGRELLSQHCAVAASVDGCRRRLYAKVVVSRMRCQPEATCNQSRDRILRIEVGAVRTPGAAWEGSSCAAAQRGRSSLSHQRMVISGSGWDDSGGRLRTRILLAGSDWRDEARVHRDAGRSLPWRELRQERTECPEHGHFPIGRRALSVFLERPSDNRSFQTKFGNALHPPAVCLPSSVHAPAAAVMRHARFAALLLLVAAASSAPLDPWRGSDSASSKRGPSDRLPAPCHAYPEIHGQARAPDALGDVARCDSGRWKDSVRVPSSPASSPQSPWLPLPPLGAPRRQLSLVVPSLARLRMRLHAFIHEAKAGSTDPAPASSQGSAKRAPVRWTLVQIAIPIIVGACVAAAAAALFWWYLRRRRRLSYYRAPRTVFVCADMSPPAPTQPLISPPAPPLPPLEPNRHPRLQQKRKRRKPTPVPQPYTPLVRARLGAPKFLFGLLPGTQSVRDMHADPAWSIDADPDSSEFVVPVASGSQSGSSGPSPPPSHSTQPSSSSSGSASSRALLLDTRTANSSRRFLPIQTDHPSQHPFNPQFADSDSDDDSACSFPLQPNRAPGRAHSRGEEEEGGRSPGWLERLWMRMFAGPVQRAPGYRRGKVRGDVPDGRFRIDAGASEPPTPTPLSGAGDPPAPIREEALRSRGLGGAGQAEAEAEQEQEQEQDEHSVLLISRVPGVDFTIASTATEVDDAGSVAPTVRGR